ncbi:MAG TPA: hypothetical protein VGJ93_11315 [Desulfuromonadaceae bacterium]|jgi:hypothetical protein
MKLFTLICLFFLTTAIPAYSGGPQNPAQTGTSPGTAATISGRIMIQGKTPMNNGIVFLYDKSMGPPPSPQDNQYWRVPDRINAIDKNGEFSFEVNGGTYYLTAAQKDPESEMGPPQVDEFNYFHGDAEGNPRPIIVTSGSRVNLGVLIPSLWSPNTVLRDKGITAIEGIVSDTESKPVKGALVFAYLSKNTTGRPIFISEKTDKNGKFLLRVHDGGTFFLKVRSVYGGGSPEDGEFQNVTKEFEPLMVALKKDQRLQGINLKVKRFSRGS